MPPTAAASTQTGRFPTDMVGESASGAAASSTAVSASGLDVKVTGEGTRVTRGLHEGYRGGHEGLGLVKGGVASWRWAGEGPGGLWFRLGRNILCWLAADWHVLRCNMGLQASWRIMILV